MERDIDFEIAMEVARIMDELDAIEAPRKNTKFEKNIMLASLAFNVASVVWLFYGPDIVQGTIKIKNKIQQKLRKKE